MHSSAFEVWTVDGSLLHERTLGVNESGNTVLIIDQERRHPPQSTVTHHLVPSSVQIQCSFHFYFSLGVSVIIHPTPSGQDDNNIIYDDDYSTVLQTITTH